MDETLTAAIRMVRTELDALHVVQQHQDLPQPPAEAVSLVADAVDRLTRAQKLLD